MSINVPADRPPIDPHPLSPYVAWAGNRNRDPILSMFKEIFPNSGNVLELASGAGNHINYFAPHFPNLSFQPSDYDVEVFDSIKKKRDEAGGKNIFDPIKIDLTEPQTWPSASDRLYDGIFVVNLFQVAPVSICDGIAQVADRVLTKNGFVAIYGPFKVDGSYTTESNAAFDQEILAPKIAEWGLKDVRDLERAANAHNIALKKIMDMPANNFILLFGRA
jgi:cyclopropane fatty-acyl-phospholipid synthase-like methyltransferase